MGPALVAGLLVLSTHVPLGVIVLNRGIIFIDIALAQVAATGVVFGTMMWGPDISEWIVQLSAVGAALACSAFLVWTDKRFPAVQEAIIGVVYVASAAVQLIMLSANPSGAEYLKKLLIGQILWVTPLQLLGVGLVYAVVLAIWFYRDLQRERIVFYVAFAIVITLSVQIVGVLLVFASLIVPALAARSAPAGLRPVVAFNIGAAGYLVGIVASALFNTPTGATIVCTLVPIAVISAVIVAALSGRHREQELPADAPAPHAPAPRASPADASAGPSLGPAAGE
ncbi:ABC transporter [Thalassobaculum fulvum]|uniref:ABC transporter n=2 Tax=Thalassobaculum fulvum TaxID=1633335 RepID=A0A918XXP0_9PROT|nr:ABC transporter [Thalassobaculum fulvum]